MRNQIQSDVLIFFSVNGKMTLPKRKFPIVPHKDEIIEYEKKMYIIKQVIYHINNDSEPFIELVLV